MLGMRLVKRTVNQDDVSAYHLFYADAVGQPGTELTFFRMAARPARAGRGRGRHRNGAARARRGAQRSTDGGRISSGTASRTVRSRIGAPDCRAWRSRTRKASACG